ncbi:hypothetical protein PoB_000173600 [Plakobranchus ocellatus]|uniref:Uncharacterized protein n=1 Tax=Plakobranchus ocellatus TaxID=259542 RepID=A0AAV3X4Q6_9GAST|nr:hypothetical protein PoB_000173600 [Plakobranchus ocellatus]
MFCDYATAQNSTLKIHLKRHHDGQQAVSRDASQPASIARQDRHKTPADDSTSNMLKHVAADHDRSQRSKTCFSRNGKPESRDSTVRRASVGHIEQKSQYQPQQQFGALNLKQEQRDVGEEVSERFPGPTTPHTSGGGGGATHLSGATMLVAADTMDRQSTNSGQEQYRKYSSSDNSQSYPRDDLRAPVWPEMLDSRNGSHSHLQSDNEERFASASTSPSFSSGNPPHQNGMYTHRKPNEATQRDDAALYGLPPLSCGWKDPLHANDATDAAEKKNLDGPEACGKGISAMKDFPASLGDHQAMGLEKSVEPIQIGDAVAPVKPDLDVCDEDEEYLNCSIIKQVVPDKAFVRG